MLAYLGAAAAVAGAVHVWRWYQSPERIYAHAKPSLDATERRLCALLDRERSGETSPPSVPPAKPLATLGRFNMNSDFLSEWDSAGNLDVRAKGELVAAGQEGLRASGTFQDQGERERTGLGELGRPST